MAAENCLQAVHDNVDVLSISLGSINSATGVPCLNSFDVALLFAVSAGVVVVHAAGNSGPYPSTMNSYGPWLISVAAGLSDRAYEDVVIARNGDQYIGTGFSGTSFWKKLLIITTKFLISNHQKYVRTQRKGGSSSSFFHDHLQPLKQNPLNFPLQPGPAPQLGIILFTRKTLSAMTPWAWMPNSSLTARMRRPLMSLWSAIRSSCATLWSTLVVEQPPNSRKQSRSLPA